MHNQNRRFALRCFHGENRGCRIRRSKCIARGGQILPQPERTTKTNRPTDGSRREGSEAARKGDLRRDARPMCFEPGLGIRSPRERAGAAQKNSKPVPDGSPDQPGVMSRIRRLPVASNEGHDRALFVHIPPVCRFQGGTRRHISDPAQSFFLKAPCWRASSSLERDLPPVEAGAGVSAFGAGARSSVAVCVPPSSTAAASFAAPC